MNVKRIFGLGILLFVLVSPIMADNLNNQAMINVVMTDEDDLPWELTDNEYSDYGINVVKVVNNLMAGGRYVESVSPTIGSMALIVHRPNTHGIMHKKKSHLSMI